MFFDGKKKIFDTKLPLRKGKLYTSL